MIENSATLRRWAALATLAWMAIIFFFSHQPGHALADFGSVDLLVKKGGHLVGYAVLAVFARVATQQWYWAMLIVVAYAISDEFHQSFVPGRTASALDVLIDSVGGALALVMMRCAAARRAAARVNP